MSKIISCILSIIIVLTISFTALAGNYVGNKRSGIFHYPDCEWAQKMRPYNIIEIDDRDEAINYYHLRPCKVCRP